jgi:TonB family protein
MRGWSLGLLLACLASAFPARAAEVIDKPDWVSLPTVNDIDHVWPVEAGRRYGDGKVIMKCEVTVGGYLADCVVVKETPANLGFGAAALFLAPDFAMRPITKDGVPVADASVVVPIHFENPPGAMPPPGPQFRMINAPMWVATPTAAQVAQALPDHAIGQSTGGRVSLVCHVMGDGALSKCDPHGEQPRGKGLGEAAMSLSREFKLAVDPNEPNVARDLTVDVSFNFPDPMNPAPVQIIHPQWTRGLDPAKLQALYPIKASDAGVRSGRGEVECAVAHSGALTGCVVVREEPPNLGFGEAAVQIASVMAMNPWTEEGRPVDGARIRLPVDLQLPAAVAASTAKP